MMLRRFPEYAQAACGLLTRLKLPVWECTIPRIKKPPDPGRSSMAGGAQSELLVMTASFLETRVPV